MLYAAILTNTLDDRQILLFGWPVETVLGILTIGGILIAIRSFIVSRRSNELGTVPTLMIKYRNSPSGDSSLELENLTNRVAYNIVIDPVFFRQAADGALYKINFVLERFIYKCCHTDAFSLPLIKYLQHICQFRIVRLCIRYNSPYRNLVIGFVY